MPKILFTAAKLKALQPQDRLVDYHSDSIPGLSLRVAPTGRKTWTFRYRVRIGQDDDGRPVFRRDREGLGHFPTVSLRQAAARATEILELVENGLDPKAPSKVPNVKTLARRYVDEWARLSKKSWREDLRIIEKDVVPRWGAYAPERVLRREVKEWAAAIAEERGRPIARQTLGTFKRIYSWAVEEELLEANPCAGVVLAGKEKPRTRVVRPEELRELWTFLEARGSTSDLAALVVLLTGQRPVEVRSMRRRDLEGHWWEVPPEITKNGFLHRVYLSGFAMSIVERSIARHEGGPLAEASDYVFPSSRKIGAPIGKNSRWWGELKRSLSFDGWQLRDLRRTFTTTTASLGVRKSIRKLCQNHLEGTTHDRHYDQYEYDAEKQRVFQLYSDHVESIVGGGAGVAKVVRIGA